MRILTVQLAWLYDDEGIKARRERLSNLGFDVTKIEDEQLKYCTIGASDSLFAELAIAGEGDMKVIASVTTE